MRIAHRLVAGALVGLTALALGPAAPAETTDSASAGSRDLAALYRTINDPNTRAYLQVLGRVDGSDMVYRISGNVYAQVPGNANGVAMPHGKKLFGFEGYNIRRLYRVPNTNDIMLLSREIVFYTDPNTGEILREWTNPIDGKTRPVVPIANDHVNSVYRVKDGKLFAVYGQQEVPVPTEPQHAHDELIWTSDVAPMYNISERYQIPENFGLKNDTYTSFELFDFYTDETEALLRSTSSYPPSGTMEVKNSWTRQSPWTPFMCMAETNHDGGLTYHARSFSQARYDDIDSWVRTEVDANYPEYRTAPTEIDPSPNATSWTSFYYDQLEPNGLTWQQWCDQ